MANGPDLDNAMEYEKKNLITTTNRINACNKWVMLFSILAVGSSVVYVSDGWFTQTLVKESGSKSYSWISSVVDRQLTAQDIPLQAGTTFHVTSMDFTKSRSKRQTAVETGSAAPGSGSGGESGTSGETTTDSSEQSGEVTTSPMDVTTDSSEQSGDETTSPMEMSGDVTTASGFEEEATTASMFELSGDETTAPMEMSGDATTATDESSGDVTTESLFEQSGETTVVTETTAAVTEAIVEQTTIEIVTADTEETTAFEVTTAADDTDEDAGLLIPFYFAIIAGVVGIILGICVVFAVKKFVKWLRKRKLVTPMHTPTSSSSYLRDTDFGKPPELNWLMAREDTLLKAMALGQISVLEFAIVEARSSGLMRDNPQLMKDAENKMNAWKRTQTQLENSYKDRDLDTMDEFMKRFNELEMKDDTGTYQRCVDLKWNMKHAELNMANAADSRNETMLRSSMAEFESLKLQDATVATNQPYQNAARVMEELRQEQLLQGRTYDGMRTDLRAAVIAREPTAIAAALASFTLAEVPDEYDDIAKANKTLEEIEEERKENLDTSLKKMEEASFTRDQDALRQSIDDCRRFGAPEADLKNPEKVLRVIEREDLLLAEMRSLTAEGDIAKLSNAIVVFKTPVVELVDKTGDVAKAEEVLEKLQEKEKMRRTHMDVKWRLENAMAIGDVTAMGGMIKAFQGLAAAGEEIDEGLLIRAMGEHEACRGQVDYRKRMEAIKSALARSFANENIPQIEDLVDQMSTLAEDKEYTMTADDSRVLDESRTALNTLKHKSALMDEIATVRPDLSVPLVPPNLEILKQAVDRMTVAKKGAEQFDGVFSDADAVLLEDARVNASTLENKVNIMTNARERLELAVEKREYIELKHSIRNAIQAPFIERKELVEPRKLAIFLDPKARRMAVKKGMRARDIGMLDVALQDFKDARVDDETLLLKGERTLDKLRKRERRRAKQERRKEKEDAKRAAEIARLTEVLRSAIASRDTEHLQLALEEFEESGFDDEDVPVVVEAEELFDTLKIQDLRERLQDAIKRRDLSGLENAVDDADYGGFVMDVKEEYDIAKELLYHLRELNNLREAISEMNRSLISEIHKYPTPPPSVHQVMAAAFTILGESPKKLKNWTEVQGLLGKLGQNAITRRVRTCVPGDIPSVAIKRAEQQLRGLKLEELGEISKGAATFFAWSTCMIKEHTQISNEQKALADIDLPDIGIPDRPQTSLNYSWIEKNA
ncbi:uncharacterized protein LOC120339424 [Styela clava]